MNGKRNLGPLLVGLALVAIGGGFLAANIFDYRLDWGRGLEFVLPSLLLLWGLSKLVRHFTWNADQIGQRPGRCGLLSGLFWTSLGAVWLLHLLGAVEGLPFVGRYWPLLVVLFGIGKIVDYYRLSGLMQFRASEVVGLLFVLLFGLGAKAAADAHLPLLRIPVSWGDDAGVQIGDYLGEKRTWTVNASIPVENARQLEITNLYGNVSVEPGEPGSVQIRLVKEVFESSESEAQRIADQIQIKSETLADGLLKVGTNRSDLPPTRSRFNSHLTLQVPPSLPLRIVNEYGDVRASGLEGPLRVENSYGEVELEDVARDVEVANRYRSSVARRIGGNLKIANQRGRLLAEDIGGNVELSTDHDGLTARRIQGDAVVRNRFGTVTLETVRGSARVEAPGSSVTLADIEKNAVVENSYRDFEAHNLKGSLELDTSNCGVELSRVAGPVTVRGSQTRIQAQDLQAGISVKARGSEVTLSDVEGGFDVATSLRSVTVENFSGRGEVQNEYGQVAIKASEPLEQPLNVSNKNGAIELTLPKDSNFKLSAQAPGGSVHSDFNPQAENAEAASGLDATIGKGGPLVRLQTTYGPIRVRRN